jgi:hypothetical protein
MTREEQIQQAEINYSDDTIFDGCDYIGQVAKQEAFIAGAKWADANPQLSKEKFIGKACDWLVMNASDYAISTTDDDDDCVVSLDMVEDFRKAMEE